MTSPAHHHHQHHSSVNELANNIDAYGDHIQSAQVHFCFFLPTFLSSPRLSFVLIVLINYITR